jgi:hypothetical protein
MMIMIIMILVDNNIVVLITSISYSYDDDEYDDCLYIILCHNLNRLVFKLLAANNN